MEKIIIDGVPEFRQRKSPDIAAHSRTEGGRQAVLDGYKSVYTNKLERISGKDIHFWYGTKEAFVAPTSKGTWDTIRKAEKMSRKVIIIKV